MYITATQSEVSSEIRRLVKSREVELKKANVFEKYESCSGPAIGLSMDMENNLLFKGQMDCSSAVEDV